MVQKKGEKKILKTWFNNSNLSIGVPDHHTDPTEHPVSCSAQRRDDPAMKELKFYL